MCDKYCFIDSDIDSRYLKFLEKSPLEIAENEVTE